MDNARPIHIQHITRYFYREPVVLGPHVLMMRPREGRDLRLLSTELLIEPSAQVSWTQDVFGNATATARFTAPTQSLVIESKAVVELNALPWPIFDIAAAAINYPFRYTDGDWEALGSLTKLRYADPQHQFAEWVKGFIRSTPTDTLALLKDLNFGVTGCFAYQSREEEGTQTPLHTLERGWGSCRDFAVLFCEAARVLGFGARIVSGYFHGSALEQSGLNAGSTHAWVEVYVPGAGWITFDPTNREVGGSKLIPVAVGHDIGQVMPVSGSFVGMTDAFKEMVVEVKLSCS